MSFAVGIFDLFTYTIPGSLLLALFGYVAARLGWIDPAVLVDVPALLSVIVVILVSYLLGYLVYPLGAAAERLVPERRSRRLRQEFVAKVPAARDRAFVHQDRHLLLSAIQLHDREVAMEVSRLRAGGLMLRNAAPLMGIGAVIAVVEIFTSDQPWFAGVLAVLLVAGQAGLVVQARRMRNWAGTKTLELCFWLPDIDDRFASDG